jgi:hypothetical protein
MRSPEAESLSVSRPADGRARAALHTGLSPRAAWVPDRPALRTARAVIRGRAVLGGEPQSSRLSASEQAT